jgi:hypothetical protein
MKGEGRAPWIKGHDIRSLQLILAEQGEAARLAGPHIADVRRR